MMPAIAHESTVSSRTRSEKGRRILISLKKKKGLRMGALSGIRQPSRCSGEVLVLTGDGSGEGGATSRVQDVLPMSFRGDISYCRV